MATIPVGRLSLGPVRRRGVIVAVVIAALAVAAFAARTPLLRLTINRLVLAGSGMRLVDADRLSLSPLGLLRGHAVLSGSGLALQQELIPYTMHVDALAADAALDGAAVDATFAIGPHQGSLRTRRANGALASVIAHVGAGAPSAIDFRLQRQPDGTPRILLRGRSTAPILAALLGQPPAAIASLPDRIDVMLRAASASRLTLAYRIVGAHMALVGHGDADLAAKRIVHDGRLRLLPSDTPKQEAENRYGAIRGQLGLLVGKIVPHLRAYALDGRLDMTFGAADALMRYGIVLTTPGKPQGPVGRLRILAAAPGQAGFPSLPLADVTIATPGGDKTLELTGTTGLIGAPRAIGIALIGGGADKPVERIAVTLGNPGGGKPLAVDVAFKDALVGGNTSLVVSPSGRLADPTEQAATPAMLGDALVALHALSPHGGWLDLGGSVTLSTGGMAFDAFRLAVPGSGLTLDGDYGTKGAKLSVDATMGEVDDAAIERLKAAAARFVGGGSVPMPLIDAQLHVGLVDLLGFRVSGIEGRYKSDSKANLRFARVVAGGRAIASDGSLHLDMPMRPGERLEGSASTPFGRANLVYTFADARTIQTVAWHGGQLTLGLAGVDVQGFVPPVGKGDIRLAISTQKPSESAAIKAALGSALTYLPDEPITGTLTVSFAGSVHDVALATRSLKAHGVAVPGPGLRLTVDGRSGAMFARLPSAQMLARADQPVHAVFTWRQRGTVQSIEDIDASLGGLRIGGTVRSSGDSALGSLTLRADHARVVAALFPGAMAVVPASMLDASVVMPVELRKQGAVSTLVAREAKVGPLSITTDISGQAEGGMSGHVLVAGPVSQTLLSNVPGWVRDIMGARQSLSAQVAIVPQQMLKLSALKLQADGATLAGQVAVPIHNGNFAWAEASGQLAGDLASIRYAAFSFPRAHWEAALGGSQLVNGRVAFDMQGGGQLTMRLGVDQRQAGGGYPNGHVQLVAQDLDLAAVCRDTGFRLLGAGRMNATLDGKVPGALVANARSGDDLFDSLARSAGANGRVSITNGVLLDVDLAERTRDGRGGVGAGERTPFKEVSGDLALANGQLEIRNGRFVAPEYALDVGGQMRVPDMALNFGVHGQIALVSRNSNGAALIKAPIPALRISGTPSHPNYDFAASTPAITRAVTTTATAVQTVNKAAGNVQAKADGFFNRHFFKPMLGKAASAAAAQQQQQPVEAAEAAPASVVPAPAARPGVTVCGA